MAKERQAVACLVAATLVYAQYYPSDSVEVERGGAVWLAAASLFTLAVWLVVGLFRMSVVDRSAIHRADHSAISDNRSLRRRIEIALDLLPWLLGGWMMLAAFGSCPPGNLRQATNEAWVWISAAAIFFLSRRIFSCDSIRRAFLTLILGCTVLQSVHVLHQQFVSLPKMRQAYKADPDAMLAAIGSDAPAGSGERSVIDNRIDDGGPSGTFALANSVAGVLLVGLLMAAAVVWRRFSSMSISERVAWGLLLGLLASAMLMTRSRTSVIAAFFGIVFFVLQTTEIRKRILVGITAAALLAVSLFGTLLAVFGRREWFEQAPASLSFRFQYWRSTLRMVAEHPWFGAGPGNFQSIYERFREPSANESIADPHHFFFETIASGGWIAGAILIFGIGVFVCAILVKKRDQNRLLTSTPFIDRVSETSVWIGASLGLLFAWLIGLMMMSIPDLDAHTFAVPIGIAVIVFAMPSLRKMTNSELNLLALSILVSLMIHLSMSSGWTIPGMAILVWLCAGMVVPKSDGVNASPNQGDAKMYVGARSKRVEFMMLVATIIGLVCVVRMSWQPILRERSALAAAESEIARGRFLQAERYLNDAENADLWSANAARWRADLYRQQLVYGQEDNDRLKKKWHSSIEEVKSRVGENPAAYRELGTAQLHVYQRFGKPADRDAAFETLKQAARWNQSDQWLAAQVAEVAAAAGETKLAGKLAERAEWLSNLGSNYDRTLDRQWILIAKPLGIAASKGPVREPASKRLEGLLGRRQARVD